MERPTAISTCTCDLRAGPSPGAFTLVSRGGRAQIFGDAPVRSAGRVGDRAVWALLPVLVASLAAGLDARSDRRTAVSRVALWAGWAVVLGAMFVPSTVTLTMVRMLVPASIRRRRARRVLVASTSRTASRSRPRSWRRRCACCPRSERCACTVFATETRNGSRCRTRRRPPARTHRGRMARAARRRRDRAAPARGASVGRGCASHDRRDRGGAGARPGVAPARPSLARVRAVRRRAARPARARRPVLLRRSVRVGRSLRHSQTPRRATSRWARRGSRSRSASPRRPRWCDARDGRARSRPSPLRSS